MTDELASMADGLAETPATEGNGDNAEPEVILEPGEEADEPTDDNLEVDEGEEGEENDEEEVDLDFAFGKYRVPKALHDAVKGLEKTFTQKTQEYNAKVKELTDQAQTRSTANDEELDLRASLRNFENEAKKFENYDWQAYQQARQQDLIGADEAWQYKQHVASNIASLKGQIQERESTRSQEAQQDLAKRVEETGQFAQSEIKGWSPEVSQKVFNYARDQGIPQDFIESNLSPTLLKILHRAWVGEQSLAKQSAALKPKPPQTPVEPTTRIKPKANPGARKPLAEWTPEDHARAMQARRKSA